MVEQSERQPRSLRTVQSVDRALDVLEVLVRGEGPVGVGEIAAATGLAQGTAHRLLRSLQERGYVRHDASRKYSLGAAAFLLGDAAQRSLARIARPHLTALVALSGETSNLAVLEGDDVAYLAQVPSPHTLRMFAEVGRHVPPHSTAVGKVLLSAMPRERAVAILGRRGLAPMTPHTITGLPALFDELDTTRAREEGPRRPDGEGRGGLRGRAAGRRTSARLRDRSGLHTPATVSGRTCDVATRDP